MKPILAALIAALVLLTMACGDQQELSDAARRALDDFNSAVQRLGDTGATAATRETLTSARREVADAWTRVSAHAEEFGQDRWRELEAGYTSVTNAIDRALATPQAERAINAVRDAASDVGSRLHDAWSDLLRAL